VRLDRRLYELSPVPLQNVWTTLYGFRLHRLRYGGIYRRVLGEIQGSQWLTHAEIQDLQMRRVRDLLVFAAKECEFYSEVLRSHDFDPRALRSVEDLRVLPTISRQDISMHGGRMKAGSARRRDVIEHYTSGTTGTPLRLFLDKNTFRRNYAFWSRFRSWFGWKMGLRRATLGGRIVVPANQLKPPFWRYNAVENQLVMSSFHIGEGTAEQFADKLLNFRPYVVEGYVSSIFTLARICLDRGIELPQVGAVQTTSETLLPHQRVVIEEAFGGKVYNQYGHGECAVFVTECEHGTLHVNEEYGLVEILDGEDPAPAGTPGEIVVTGLNNWTMPLIRYRTGDIGVASPRDEMCECGRGLSALRSIEGRVLDVLHLPDGRTVPPTALTLLFDRAHALGIQESRVRQVSCDRIVVEIVRRGSGSRKQKAMLEQELRLIVGEAMEVRFEEVPRIPRTETGKFKFVVCETGGGE
jgi:phenylacetate-CoA ligase